VSEERRGEERALKLRRASGRLSKNLSMAFEAIDLLSYYCANRDFLMRIETAILLLRI
jgi:hypothetical protein